MEETSLGLCGDERGGGVPLAKDKTVSFFPARIMGINLENTEVKHSEYIGNGKAATEVTSTGRIEHFENIDANIPGMVYQTIDEDLRLVLVTL